MSSTQSPTTAASNPVSFFALAVFFIITVCLLIYCCYAVHRGRAHSLFHTREVRRVEKELDEVKNITDQGLKNERLKKLSLDLNKLTQSSDIYLDIYEGSVEPLLDNKASTLVTNAFFHNPVGRSCVIAGGDFMQSISSSMGFLWANVTGAAIVAVSHTYTDFVTEALVVSAVAVFLLYIGTLMLKAAQHQCFQDRMNGDYSIFEKDACD
jgi:hypothetical protein